MRIAVLALIATLAAATAANAAERYYQRYSIIKSAGQSAVIPVPASDVPVRFDVSVRFDDPALIGTMVASALITKNSQTGAISWVATRDESLTGGNTAAGDTYVTAIVIGSAANRVTLTSFEIQNGPIPRLKLIQLPSTGAAKGYYTVTVYY